MTGKAWLPPRQVQFDSGTHTKVPGDFVTGPGLGSLLVSPRFVVEWTHRDLRGVLEWAPVEVLNYVHPYYLPIFPLPHIRAVLAQMDVSMSDPSMCPYCDCARIVDSYNGVVIDESRWAGEDMFPLTNLGILLVTERVHSMFREHDFVGAKLVPAAEYRPSFAKR